MPYVIAQLSDVHIGGPHAGCGDRFSTAIAEINAMSRRPDLVLLTGDLTQDGSPADWAEFKHRLEPLEVRWEAIAGNHDPGITELAGHRAVDAGPLRLVLVDSCNGEFDAADAAWLDEELSARDDQTTVVAIHHPPFETGIWWMDCVGLTGTDRFETVVRRHPHVVQVVAGHVHRPIATNWGGCAVWVSPSTAVAIAVDLDPAHDPAESAESPSYSLHAYTDRGVVSHVVPVGAAATRTLIEPHVPEFVAWAREIQQTRTTDFG